MSPRERTATALAPAGARTGAPAGVRTGRPAIVELGRPSQEPETASTRGRIIAAALCRCEEVGLRGTTMEDIARQAGVGRATLYRYFDSKDALVSAVIRAEAERFFGQLDEAITDCGAREERLVEGFAVALEYVRHHPLLEKLLRAEPEALLPYLLGDSPLVSEATEAVSQRIGADTDEAEVIPSCSIAAREAAEVVVRLVLSLALSPDSVLGTEDREGARRLARRLLVPSLCARH